MTSEKEREIIESVIGKMPGNGSVLISMKSLRMIVQATIRNKNLKIINDDTKSTKSI